MKNSERYAQIQSELATCHKNLENDHLALRRVYDQIETNKADKKRLEIEVDAVKGRISRMRSSERPVVNLKLYQTDVENLNKYEGYLATCVETLERLAVKADMTKSTIRFSDERVSSLKQELMGFGQIVEFKRP